MKTIKIEYDGKTYILGYTYQTLLEAEKRGLDWAKAGSRSMTTIYKLFECSFLLNHKKELDKKLIDIEGILAAIPNKYDVTDESGEVTEKGFFTVLSEIVGDAASALSDNGNGDGKNAMWAVQ